MPARDHEECEYCWKRATREHWQGGVGRWVYCRAHAPTDATPIRHDIDGSRIRMEEEEAEED